MSQVVGEKQIELKSFEMSFPMWIGFLASISVGAICLYLISLENANRAWLNVLIGTCIFLGLGLSGLFFLLINNLVRARWMIAMRRVFEASAMTLPVAALLAFIVFLGRDSIFEWMDPEVVATDPLIRMKSIYLNETFFGFRLIAVFAVFLGSSWYLVRNSLRQDHDGQLIHSTRNYVSSAIFMVLFAVSVTVVAFDLLLSLDPHWFSTIYGVYYFAAFFQAGLAVAYLVVWYLHRRGIFAGVVNRAHFHDLGKMLFAFSVFWAYIVYSQFMLIWYADIPEETFWYKERFEGAWHIIFWILPVVRWALPFLILLPYAHKTNFKIVLPVCVLILFGHWLDFYWNAMPALRLFDHSDAAVSAASVFDGGLIWQEALVGLGFFSLFFVCLGLIIERIRVIPIRDPQIQNSIHHHE
ncbi:MAG: hypothetical protein EA369_10120 [Bradymonadales bacterium]|nr:MAG: hypothetical protein EA369_10120 [Bradymonadales bacterium]